VSGEESEHQVKMRAERLQADFKGKGNDANCFVLTETNTQNIFKHIEALEPGWW
jgi:DNA repair protein RadA/Sms